MRQSHPSFVTSSGSPRPARPLRILIVDDNKDAAAMLGQLLAHEGHEAREVHKAEAVLDFVRSFRPNAVLLDIVMPGLSGYDVARRLKERLPDTCPALIAVTALGRSADRILGKMAGFDYYLTKPCDFDALLAVLAEVAAPSISPPSPASANPGVRQP